MALVLFDHIQPALLGRFIRPWTQSGQHGVTVFFVLSGFLITSKLIEGPIDLKNFYIRRFFRLMPVAWVYLAVLMLIGYQIHTPIAGRAAVLSSLFFYRNYVDVDFGATTWHFWSLSLEEQFYLIWPWILLFAGLRRSVWIAAAGAVGCALYRWQLWAYYSRGFYNSQSQVRGDALLIGSLMALLLSEPRLRVGAVRWSRWWWLPALAGLFYCIRTFSVLPTLMECMCIALLISASMLHPGFFLARPLSFRPLVVLGIASYSTYVWQAPFTLLAWGNGPAGILTLFVGLPLVVFASYRYIERPLTRLGHRITRHQSPKAGTIVEVNQ